MKKQLTKLCQRIADKLTINQRIWITQTFGIGSVNEILLVPKNHTAGIQFGRNAITLPVEMIGTSHQDDAVRRLIKAQVKDIFRADCYKRRIINDPDERFPNDQFRRIEIEIEYIKPTAHAREQFERVDPVHR